MLLLIAWRNLWRNKLRSLLIVASIAVGVWAGGFYAGFSWGMHDQRIRDAIETEVSHLQVHHPRFQQDYEPRYLVARGPALVQELGRLPGMAAVSGRTVARGMVASAYSSVGLQLNGIEPAAEHAVTGLGRRVAEGTYFATSQKTPAILLSTTTAQKLRVRLRQKVVITLQDTSGTITSGAFRVVGLYRSLNTRYDEANAFVPREELNRLLGVPGTLNEVALRLRDAGTLAAATAAVRARAPGLRVQDWTELAPEVQLMLTSFDQSMFIFLLILALALAFGIVNTLLMAVMERTREIGMLKAVGMSKPRVCGMIVGESVALALVGCPLGLGLAYLTVQYFGHRGIDLSLFARGLSSFGMSNIVYPKLALHHYVITGLVVFLTALLAGIYPMFKAVNLKPAEALRRT
jgi:ABC-type lipoprotein release transport system permease subunit